MFQYWTGNYSFFVVLQEKKLYNSQNFFYPITQGSFDTPKKKKKRLSVPKCIILFKPVGHEDAEQCATYLVVLTDPKTFLLKFHV